MVLNMSNISSSAKGEGGSVNRYWGNCLKRQNGNLRVCPNRSKHSMGSTWQSNVRTATTVINIVDRAGPGSGAGAGADIWIC